MFRTPLLRLIGEDACRVLHVHVHHSDGEAKFWMDPRIELAQNYGLSEKHLREARGLIEEHSDEIRNAWQVRFPG